MYDKLIIAIFWSAFLLVFTPLSGQNLFEDIRKCRETYKSANTFQCEVDIKVYQAGESGPVLSRRCDITRKGEKYLYTLDNLILLLNSDYSIMVMKDKKSMLIKKQEPGQKHEEGLTNADLEALNMDSLFQIAQNNTRSEYLGKSNGRKSYKVYFDDGYYKSATVYIDEGKSFLSRMTFEYNKSIAGIEASTDVNFRNIHINTQIQEIVFSSEKFIRKSKSGIVPAPEYQSYKVYDVADF